MREIDRRAREEFGIPEGVLMEHAGAAVTCGLPKIGLVKGRGRSFSGRVTVADISLPWTLTR